MGAETNALKGGKKAMNKMETRIRELESEMDAEGRRAADAQKNLRRSERRIKELAFAGDEDRKNHERMQGLIDSLQGKIKTYKKQLEEAEEIAALNLSKFRKVQGDLQESSNLPSATSWLWPRPVPVAAPLPSDPSKKPSQQQAKIISNYSCHFVDTTSQQLLSVLKHHY